LLTKGNVFVSHLYNGSSDNKHYFYHFGINVQAVIAYLVGIALPFPGFVGTLGPTVSPAAQNLGHLGWLLSFVASFVVYYLICLVWPTRNQRLIKEMGLGWEEMGNREIIAADGTVITDEQEGYPDTNIGVYGTEKLADTYSGEDKHAHNF
jgi:nucleobase:cation symporter-1, NCS1 family